MDRVTLSLSWGSRFSCLLLSRMLIVTVTAVYRSIRAVSLDGSGGNKKVEALLPHSGLIYLTALWSCPKVERGFTVSPPQSVKETRQLRMCSRHGRQRNQAYKQQVISTHTAVENIGFVASPVTALFRIVSKQVLIPYPASLCHHITFLGYHAGVGVPSPLLTLMYSDKMYGKLVAKLHAHHPLIQSTVYECTLLLQNCLLYCTMYALYKPNSKPDFISTTP